MSDPMIPPQATPGASGALPPAAAGYPGAPAPYSPPPAPAAPSAYDPAGQPPYAAAAPQPYGMAPQNAYAPAPQQPYGYAPGQVQPSPYAPQGQPYASQPYAVQTRPTNGMALASMICGIAGFLFSPTIAVFLITVLLPIAAVVLGHIALGQLKRNPGAGGRGMAITGLVLGYIPIVLSAIGIIILIVITVSFGAFTLPFVFAS